MTTAIINVNSTLLRKQEEKNDISKVKDLHSNIAIPLFAAFTTYLGYAILIIIGHVRDFFGYIFKPDKYRPKKGQAPLLVDFEHFYTRRLYHRIRDCWNRPICSVPGPFVDLVERVSNDYNLSFKFTGKIKHCLNLGSYNYLGFAQCEGETTDDAVTALKKYGVTTSSSRMELGTHEILLKLEKAIANFINKEDAIVFGMGFATNSTVLPALCSKGTLIISDSLNHASLVVGARSSEAKIKTFKHNDPKDCEKMLRESIIQGQPRTHQPWKKIYIIVEGLYSMEGEICKLPQFVALKKKYKAYLYVDEAHSIGAIGKSGRGVCEYNGVDPSNVDILMGTFTKSFGSCGGYVAGSHDFIKYLRHTAYGALYAETMSPAVAQQALTALQIINGERGGDEGKKRIIQLRENSIFFRTKLKEMGFHVYGNLDSPVIPLMLYNPAKIPAFSRECLKKGLAVVVVGFPATPLILSRARFCLSASHTRKNLEEALEKISEVGDLVMVKYKKYF